LSDFQEKHSLSWASLSSSSALGQSEKQKMQRNCRVGAQDEARRRYRPAAASVSLSLFASASTAGRSFRNCSIRASSWALM
jgi:hypothetical protein